MVTPVQADLDDDKSIEKAFDFIAEQYGRVNVLINNAGKRSNLSELGCFFERCFAHKGVTQADNPTLKCIPET